MGGGLVHELKAGVVLEDVEHGAICLPEELEPWRDDGAVGAVARLLTGDGGQEDGLGGLGGLEILDALGGGALEGGLDLVGLGLGLGDLLLCEFDEALEDELRGLVVGFDIEHHVMDYVSRTSMVPTLVFWAVFLYWYRPSFASLPLRRSTHSSTNRTITGSSEAMGLLRVRLEVTCSWSSWRAACCWSTPMSSWARLLCGVSEQPRRSHQGGAQSVLGLAVRRRRHAGQMGRDPAAEDKAVFGVRRQKSQCRRCGNSKMVVVR